MRRMQAYDPSNSRQGAVLSRPSPVNFNSLAVRDRSWNHSAGTLFGLHSSGPRQVAGAGRERGGARQDFRTSGLIQRPGARLRTPGRADRRARCPYGAAREHRHPPGHTDRYRRRVAGTYAAGPRGIGRLPAPSPPAPARPRVAWPAHAACASRDEQAHGLGILDGQMPEPANTAADSAVVDNPNPRAAWITLRGSASYSQTHRCRDPTVRGRSPNSSLHRRAGRARSTSLG